MALPDIAEHKKILDRWKSRILILSCHEVPIQHNVYSIWLAGYIQEEKNNKYDVSGHYFSSSISSQNSNAQDQNLLGDGHDEL